MNLSDVINSNFAIWGIGKEGLSILKEIRKRNKDISVNIINDSEINKETKEQLKNYEPICIYNTYSKIKDLDIIIKSPGVSYYKDEIKEALNNNIKITSLTNLWLAENENKKKLFITASKGKSTTTALTTFILNSMGINAISGGNIGSPLFDLSEADVYVLELSSYQITDLEHRADIGAILNLYPAHQIWHKSVEQYYEDKLKVTDNIKKLLLNKEFSYPDINHNNVSFYNTNDSFHFDKEFLYHKEKKLVSLKELKIIGEHNYSNLCCALSLASEFGEITNSVIEKLIDFSPIPHRLEDLGIHKEIKYINDSISTIPESTLAALRSVDSKNISLLVGGQEVEADWSVVFNYLTNNPINALIGLPDSGKKIIENFNKYIAGKNTSIKTYISNDLSDAVKFAKENTLKNGLILLSPGTPSYGKYKNFEERGLEFKNTIQ